MNENAFDALLDQINKIDERMFGSLYYLTAFTNKYFVSPTIVCALQEYDFNQHRLTIEDMLAEREKGLRVGHPNYRRARGAHLRVVRG